MEQTSESAQLPVLSRDYGKKEPWMRSFVIGLVVLFAVFTFVGALEQPAHAEGTAPLEQAGLSVPASH
jgi:hypothetical protein